MPELVPIRYGRMLVSPFTFYRGAALLMASDLARTPRSGLTTQVCGDAHLMNFGVFGSPERRLVFDINDFDETLPGPWEWDVKRLAASFAIAGRDNGFSTKDRRKVLLSLMDEYRTAMRSSRGCPTSPSGTRTSTSRRRSSSCRIAVDPAARKRAQANVAKARTQDSMRALAKLTHVVDGQHRIISDPPLIQPIEELVDGIDHDQLMDTLRAIVRGYRRTLQSDRRAPAGGLPTGPRRPQGRRASAASAPGRGSS